MKSETNVETTSAKKEIKELLIFAFTLLTSIKAVLEDKKVTWFDVFKMSPVLPTIKPAFSDLGNPAELLAKLTPTERTEILQELGKEFDLTSDQCEALVERSVLLLGEIVDIAREWVALTKVA